MTDLTRNCYFRADYARGLAIFMAENDVRYYLNGVYVEPHPVAGVTLVATNGSSLIVIHDKDGFSNGNWICKLSKPFLAASKKRHGGLDVSLNKVVFSGDAALAVCSLYDPRLEGSLIRAGMIYAEHSEPVEGVYPDFRRVIPTSFKASDAGFFNAEYLARLGALTKALGLKNQAVQLMQQDARSSMLCTVVNESISVIIMPMNFSEKSPACKLPEWLVPIMAKKPESLAVVGKAGEA